MRKNKQKINKGIELNLYTNISIEQIQLKEKIRW